MHLHHTWRKIVIMLSAAMISLSITSCRTHKDSDFTTKRRHWHTHRDDGDKGGKKDPGITVDDGEDWVHLNVKPDKRENQALYDELKTWLGVPYRYGGKTRKGADCSGLVMEVYKAAYGIDLERNSARQFEKNCKEVSRSKLREGDLVFFNNGRSNGITHVGIYLRDGKFVHASSSRGVIVSDLSERYYDTHFQCAGRPRR